MNAEEFEVVSFTAKGQVVIPAQLRRQYEIKEGTRAVVIATPEGILLKPVTRHAIDRLHGILKRRRDELSVHEAAGTAAEPAEDGGQDGR